MLSKEKTKELKDQLTIQCDNTTYEPNLYLQKGSVSHLVIAYIISDKRCNFTLPLFLFENTDNSKAYESAQEEFIREVKRNVRLAHKREELFR